MKNLILIEGYVLNEFVTARIYPGKDEGLSHYTFKDKTYFGTVQFTQIIKQSTQSY